MKILFLTKLVYKISHLFKKNAEIQKTSFNLKTLSLKSSFQRSISLIFQIPKISPLSITT